MVKHNLPPKPLINPKDSSSKAPSITGGQISNTASNKNIDKKPFSFNTLDITTGEDSIENVNKSAYVI